MSQNADLLTFYVYLDSVLLKAGLNMLLGIVNKWEPFVLEESSLYKVKDRQDCQVLEEWLDTLNKYRDLFKDSHWIIPLDLYNTETVSIPVNNLDYYLYLQGRFETYRGLRPSKEEIEIPTSTAFFQIFRKLNSEHNRELFILPALLFLLHYQVPLPENLNDFEVIEIRQLAQRIKNIKKS